MTQLAAQASEAPTWVPFVSVAGAIIIFLAGLAVGPFVKSREALFQEHRHNRRLLQELAQDMMVRLAAGTRKFSPKMPQHFSHGVREFGKELNERKFALSRTDRAACHRFTNAIKDVDDSTDAADYAARLNKMYDRYLDVQRPVRRWLQRRAARRRFYEEIRRDQIVPAAESELVDDLRSDVQH